MSIRQEQVISPNLLHRVEILQSNIGRVYHQHETLKPILQYSYLFPQIQKLLNMIESIKVKANKIKDMTNNLYVQSKDRKFIPLNSQQSIESKFKKVGESIYNLKERLRAIEKNIQNPYKDFISAIRSYTANMNMKVNEKIQNSKIDIQQLLSHIKQKENKWVNQNLSNQSSKESKKYEILVQNIMRQLGLVHCQVMYLIDVSRKEQINKELSSIKIQKDQIIKNVQLGRLQRKFLEIQLDQFIYQNSSRLNYQSNLIKCKIQQLSQCLKNKKNNQNVAKEISYIQSKMKQIKNQQSGIQKYLDIQNSKICHNIQKINQLSQNDQQFQKYKINSSRFQVFKKVKSKIKSVEDSLQTLRKSKIIQ